MENSLRTIINIGMSIYNPHQIKLFKIEKLNLSSCILISLKKYHSNISQNVLLHARTHTKKGSGDLECVYLCVYVFIIKSVNSQILLWMRRMIINMTEI